MLRNNLSLRGNCEAKGLLRFARKDGSNLKKVIASPSARNDFYLVCIIFFLAFLFLVIESCFAQEEFVYDSKGAHNPFIPLVTADGRLIKLSSKETAEGPSLEGIMYEKTGASFAVVNGEIVKEGDILGNYQVVKIKQDKVIFSKGGQFLEIKLEKEEK